MVTVPSHQVWKSRISGVPMLAKTAFALGLAVVSASCMPMSTLEERMPRWVGTVPYSHLVNETWGYPTDCSGFVSWALSAGSDIKAYEWSASKYATAINVDDLRYGDTVSYTHLTLPTICSV